MDRVMSYMFEPSQLEDDNDSVSLDVMQLRQLAQPRYLRSSTQMHQTGIFARLN